MFSIGSEQENHRVSDYIGSHIVLGNRPIQQDAVFTTMLDDNFIKLSHPNRILALKNIVKKIQSRASQGQGGSTLCPVLTWRDAERVHFYAANLGDSSLHMIVINRTTGKKTIKRVNALHTTDPDKNKHEFSRLCNALQSQTSNQNGFSLRQYKGEWRLFNSLGHSQNVSRSIGDADFAQSHSLFHEPDIYYFDEPVADDEDVCFISGSDALEVLDSNQFLELNWNNSAEGIAAELVELAFYTAEGHSDNACAAVIKVKHLPEEQKKIFFAIAADGHGLNGDYFSEFIANYSHEILEEEVLALLPASDVDVSHTDHHKLQISPELICQLITMKEVGRQESGIDISKSISDMVNGDVRKVECTVDLQASPMFLLMIPEENGVFRWINIKNEMLFTLHSSNFIQLMAAVGQKFSEQLSSFQLLSTEIYRALLPLQNTILAYQNKELSSYVANYLQLFKQYKQTSIWEVDLSYDNNNAQMTGVFRSFEAEAFLQAFEQYHVRLNDMLTANSLRSSSASAFFKVPLKKMAQLIKSEAYMKAKHG